MKKNTKLIGAIVLAAAAGIFIMSNVMATESSVSTGYTVIKKTDIVNSISARGVVGSVEKDNVYSTLGFTIKEVNVEVGERVTAGQVLCTLDTQDLEFNIAQQKADLDASQQSNLNQLQNTQRIYNEAADNLKNGTNAQILNAIASFNNAEVNLETAQKNYNDALKENQDGTNAGVVNAESSLLSAKTDLETKTTAFENNKVLFSAGAISREAYEQSENAFVTAQSRYDDAVISLENAMTSQRKALEQAESTLKTARINYDNASAANNTAVASANQDIKTFQNNVANAQVTANNDSRVIAIQKLEKQLEDSIIKAPVNGTVTAVYAKKGAAGSGLMFVIEDTDNLEITTTIKEYDIAKVKPGMEVSIKSDSTGDSVYEGVISRIDPAAVKSANGETAIMSDVEFGCQIDISSKETDLKIGMNTRLNIILEKKDDVFCVPYDAVATDINGNDIIYVITESGRNGFEAKATPVQTGMETDFFIEISGGGITEDTRVVSDASATSDGMKLALD